MIVEITVNNMYERLKIVVCEDKLFVNGKQKQVDCENFLRRLFCIITPWEKKLVNLSVLDGESYSVKITEGDNATEYLGRNKFPKNYREFKELINEVK